MMSEREDGGDESPVERLGGPDTSEVVSGNTRLNGKLREERTSGGWRNAEADD